MAYVICLAMRIPTDDLIAGLNIHDEIERGDNDSIKLGGKNVKVDKPCS